MEVDIKRLWILCLSQSGSASYQSNKTSSEKYLRTTLFCLALSISISHVEASRNEATENANIDASRRFYLWQSMRHTSPSIRIAQEHCFARNQVLHTNVSDCLAHSFHYSCATLARLESLKFFSDIVESKLGAKQLTLTGLYFTVWVSSSISVSCLISDESWSTT